MSEKQQEKPFVHVYINTVKFLDTGSVITVRPIPQEFITGLAHLMALHKISHVDAFIIPCKKEHTIKLELGNQDDQTSKKPEEGDQALGP